MNNKKVSIMCYGTQRVMEREQAKKFYLDCMKNSEGSEYERYANIYMQLMNEKSHCYDEFY